MRENSFVVVVVFDSAAATGWVEEVFVPARGLGTVAVALLAVDRTIEQPAAAIRGDGRE